MEEDIDIYADLPTFGTKYSENLDSKNEQDNLREQLDLKNQIAELTTKLNHFQKINENLEINLFSLLKTAKAEIARKDKMIEQLRKELDDVTFKRGMYLKTNNIEHRKSDFYETHTNMHNKWDSFCPVKKNDTEIIKADPICKQAGEHQTKSPLVPATLFGERLLKRMTDKYHMELKDVHLNSHINSENCNQNIEYYVFESNKENGTISDNNTKEAPSGTKTQSSVNEYVNNVANLTTSKDTVKGFQLNNETKVHSGLHQNLTFAMRNGTGKRTIEVVDQQVSRKRIKSVNGKFSSELRSKDTCNTVVIANKEDTAIPQYRSYSSSANSFEMRSRFIKDSEHSRSATVDLKKRGHFIREAKNREDRYSKHQADVFCVKRDTIERSFKHHGAAVQNSMFSLSEKNMNNRYIKVSKKDSYLVIQGEHRKLKPKHKEHQHIEDHRTRMKVASSTKYREEQHNRSHSNYGSRCEKRYNFRYTDADKTKLLKDASNIRNMTKYSVTDETFTVERTNDAKTHADNAKFESRKLKSESGNSHKRKRKQNECNGNVEQQISIGQSVELLTKYSEVQEQSTQWADNAMKPRNQCVVTETEHTVVEELQKYVKERLQDSLPEIEDSEVLNTSNMQKGNRCEESTYETRCAFKEPDSASNVDNILTANPEHSITTVEQMKESKLSLTVISQPKSILTSSSSPSQDQTNSESVESVENVENIERFIRDCAPMIEKASQKVSTTLNVIHALENSSTNMLPKVDDTVVLLDACNSEDNTNECCHSISNFNGVGPSVKRDCRSDDMRDESSSNDLTLYTSNICTSDGKHIQMQVEQPISFECIKGNSSTNEREPLNSAESAPVQLKKMIENSPKEHSAFSKDTIEEETSYNHMNNIGEKTNVGERLNSKSNEDQNNRNGYTSIATVKSEQKNVNIIIDVVPKEATDKRAEETQMQSTDCDGLAYIQSCNKPAWDSSKNIQGKIVVFARRKKPVCLANSNANMTILINKESNTSVSSSVLKTAISGCNSFLNVIKIGSNEEMYRN